MDAFSKYHPAVILCYYVVAALTVIIGNRPALSFTALVMAALAYGSVSGWKKCLYQSLISLGAMFLCVIINPLFNHRGVTVLFEVGEIKITRESVLYGGNMALMLFASLFLFACFSHYMTSEKIMVLFAGRFPSFSLLFSMVLRLIPKVGRDFKEMTALHGKKPAVYSALMGILLEESLEKGLSMKSRGYGRGTRTCFYRRRLRRKDIALLFFALLTGAAALWSAAGSGGAVRFFPSIRIEPLPVWQWFVFPLYFSVPLILRGKEEIAWLLSRRKITGLPIRNS